MKTVQNNPRGWVTPWERKDPNLEFIARQIDEDELLAPFTEVVWQGLQHIISQVQIPQLPQAAILKKTHVDEANSVLGNFEMRQGRDRDTLFLHLHQLLEKKKMGSSCM